MLNSSRFVAFIVPFLVFSSLLFIFIFKDFFLLPKLSRPTEPDHNDRYEPYYLHPPGNSTLLPVIIDGENITAVMSSKHMMYQEAVEFCKEKNMSLAQKPFEVQSLKGVERGFGTWINASIDESRAITAPNREMHDIISSTMERIADVPLYIIQSYYRSCYIYVLRTGTIKSPLEINSIEIICKDTLNHMFTSDINNLPCEPLIITKKFLEEKIFPIRTGYLGYNTSFFSGLTRGQFIEKRQSLDTNLTFCVDQNLALSWISCNRANFNTEDCKYVFYREMIGMVKTMEQSERKNAVCINNN